jgi:hypothetical protein
MAAFAALSVVAASQAADETAYVRLPSAEVISADIDRYGAGAVLWQRLWNAKSLEVFEALASNITSGDVKWINVGFRLRAVSDAGASELLEISFAKALPHSPARILELGNFESNAGGIWLTQICRGEVWGEESTKDEIRKWFDQTRVALGGPLPSNLTEKVQRCLGLLNEGSAAWIKRENAFDLKVKANADVCNTALPQEIATAIRRRFSDMTVLQVSNLVEDDQQIWLNNVDALACPGIAIGHFMHATENAYAVALIKAGAAQRGLDELVVVASKQGEAITIEILESSREVPIAAIVRRAGPGVYKDWQDPEKKRSTNLDVVVLERLEASATAFIFDNGKFREITFSN